jgi:predicted nucleotidyltransferase
VALFGSAARGEAGTESDLDILVVGPRDASADHTTWREQLDALEADAFAWTGNDTRVIEYGDGEVVRRQGDPLLDVIAAEGIALFGTLDVLKRRAAKRS